MKWVAWIVAGLMLGGGVQAQSLIEPNSTFFSVQDYYYPKPDGDYEYYQVAGFRQAPSAGVAPVLFLLPTIGIRSEDVRYFKSSGLPAGSAELPGLITIRPTYFAGMPSSTQMPAIAASLAAGVSLKRFEFPSLRSGPFPVMTNEAVSAPNIRAAIEQDSNAQDAVVTNQTNLMNAYSSYEKRNATLSNVEVRLLIGGEVAASRTYSGSLTSMGAINLLSPSEFQANLIRSGEFEIEVVSRFKDTKTSSISARFDALEAVRAFAEETQRAITTSKSSGFQVFGIGSRRSKMSTSIDRTMRSDAQVEHMDNTRVVMWDATDEMVKEFEEKFFPSLSRQQTIDGHLKAAEAASKAGDHALAKIHSDYADAVSAGNQMKEVDTVAAAAALSAGDYVGFIAHGVRAINNSDTKANNFRRLEAREAEVRSATSWDQARVVTVNREVSVPVQLSRARNYVARVGICGLRQGVGYIWVAANTWGAPQPVSENGLMISCVETASPAAVAGLIPGMTIRFVDGNRVRTTAELDQIFSSLAPGDVVEFMVVQPPSPGYPFSSDGVINVHSKRGPEK